MKPAEIRKQIKAGETGPLYLLEGADQQSRHELAAEFDAVVDEGLHAFNVQHLYASEATSVSARDALISDILSSARTLPMMVPRRVITVHGAETLLSPKKGKDDDQELLPGLASTTKRKRSRTPVEEFEQYLESPEPTATLIFVAGYLDANRRLVKLLRKHAVSVDCGTLANPAEAAKWIRARLEVDELTIEPQAISVLLQATGLNLGSIRAEVEKLVLFAAGESTVTMKHVREMVRPQSEMGENFALGNAIWKGDARGALREVDAQLEAGFQPLQILGQVRAAARGLKPDERVRNGLDAVFRTDIAMKSSGGEARFLIERLVVELCGR